MQLHNSGPGEECVKRHHADDKQESTVCGFFLRDEYWYAGFCIIFLKWKYIIRTDDCKEDAQKWNINYASVISLIDFKIHIFDISVYLFITLIIGIPQQFPSGWKMERNRASPLSYRSRYKLWIKPWQWINKFGPEGEHHQEAWQSTRNQYQWRINSKGSSNVILSAWSDRTVPQWNRKLLYHWSWAGWTRSHWNVHPQHHSTHLCKTSPDSPWEKRLAV